MFNREAGNLKVSMIASSSIDRAFNSKSDQTKDYTTGICCFSDKYTSLKIVEIGIMCSSEATCLPVDYLFSELAL